MAKRRITEWQTAITDRLRLDFQMIERAAGQENEYSIALSGEISGRWETLAVYDNCHEPPHRHDYHPDGSRSEHKFVAALPQTFFAEAQNDLMHGRAEQYLDEFERRLGNMKWGRSDDD